MDEPIDNAILLGLGDVIETLDKFLSSTNLIAPLAIAVNGEWGSGKTSLIRTLKNKLSSNQKLAVVIFDAWKYEYSDPAVGLFWTIAEEIGDKNKMWEKIKKIGDLAIDVFARRYIGMSLKEIKEHFTGGAAQGVKTIASEVEGLIQEAIGDKRVVVFIDDLDRCSLENVLQILDAMKLFLNIKKCIFVVAVDMEKIKLAWSWRYGKEGALAEEGRKYLEKIFQIVTGIPKPSLEHVKEYIQSLIPEMPDEFVDLLAKTGPRNPRQIKRLLNLMSLRSIVGVEPTRKLEVSFIWTLLEEMVGKEKAINLYNTAGGQDAFYDLIIGMKDIGREAYQNKIHTTKPFNQIGGLPSAKDSITFDYFRISGKIISGFREPKTNICRSIAEVVDFSNEIYR